jgi:hypothetical protein
MWDFLKNLPPVMSFVIILLLILSLLIVLLWGKVKAKIGNQTIAVGGGDVNPMPMPPPTTIMSMPPQTTCLTFHKRSCGDCILVIMGEREKVDINIHKEQERLPKVQMSFTEHLLMSLLNIIMEAVSVSINDYKTKAPSSVDESIQYKLAYGLTKDAILMVKDEIRRSFNEGDFYGMSRSELSTYIDERISTVTFMMSTYLKNIYPDRVEILNVREILKIFDSKSNLMSKMVEDIYTHACSTKAEIDSRIEALKKDFGRWVDGFIG